MKTLFERMSEIARGGSKADYVRGERAKGTGNHHCHWPGCVRSGAPFCRDHLWRLPRVLRANIENHVPGCVTAAVAWAQQDILRERGWTYDL